MWVKSHKAPVGSQAFIGLNQVQVLFFSPEKI